MNKQFFVQLTNDLYRLTILFPKEEPIRIKIRGLADDILTDLITILQGTSPEKREASKRLERNIGILESMLEIAEGQKWVKEEDFEDLKQKYSSIRKEIEEFNRLQEQSKPKEINRLSQPEPPKEKSQKLPFSLNSRQKKIIELLKEKEKIQVQDVIPKLDKKITKRTIRRDFTKLLELDLIIKEGKANMTYYLIKNK